MRPNLSGDKRIPIYQRIADTLRDAVVNGQLRPGDRAPSDTTLSEDYNVAPGTVRKALDILVTEGVFERFQGRGTFVCRPSFDASLSRFFRFREPGGELQVPGSRILRRIVEPIPGHVAQALEIEPGAPGISMSRLRIHANVPVVAEEIWLDFKKFNAFMEIEIEDMGDLLYPIYDNVCGQLIARASEKLTAELAQRKHARVLRVDAGTPLIVIERVARGYNNVPLEWRRSRGRAEQFTYHTEIR